MEFADSEAFWEDLPNQWRVANREARVARAAITTAFAEHLAGRAQAPPAEQIAYCRRLENQADSLGEELAVWVEKAFAR